MKLKMKQIYIKKWEYETKQKDLKYETNKYI